MRRARIKAVATVPVRRKAATQDSQLSEPIAKVNIKESKNVSEVQEESNVEPVKITKEQNQEKNIVNDAPVVTVSLENHTESVVDSVPPIVEKKNISQVSEKKELLHTSNTNESKLRNETPHTIKIENLQKSPTLISSNESSPVKIAQSHARSCFMRPTPRLDGGGRNRRNSIQGSGASASESEDDSKRSNSVIPSRVRNDSMCSVQSLKDGTASNIAKLNLGQKRRMVVSESARKLAEARREFLLKHENKTPDKSKLTMYDLIYYNPTSNPMKPKPVQARPVARKMSICSNAEQKNEEEETAEEPSEMLVPQVKVGPNGQLIIDEQSLVIDQYKAQEKIDRSDIIIDDGTSGSGFYKRRQKSKEWSKWETVKFYKALNTYGTDFLLMQSIFPKRTRQELKLKYKKEERLNRVLIEKALQYQEFDTDALEKDLATVEESERKESEMKKAKPSKPKRKRRKRCTTVTAAISCDEEDEEEEVSNKISGNEQSSDADSRITVTKLPKKRAMRKRKAPAVDEDSCNESLLSDSDSEPEIYKTKPTRSGRFSKENRKLKEAVIMHINNKSTYSEKKKKAMKTNLSQNDTQNDTQNQVSNNIHVIIRDKIINYGNTNSGGEKILPHDADSEDEAENDNADDLGDASDEHNNKTVAHKTVIKSELKVNVDLQKVNEISDEIPNMADLKPGSLVVFKKHSVNEPGKTTVQVYIVTADFDAKNPTSKDNLVPIELTPDVLKTVTRCIKDIDPDIAQKCNVP